MTEQELDHLVQRLGAARAKHITDTMRTLMPTLLKRPAGANTLAFITALEAATERARCQQQK